MRDTATPAREARSRARGALYGLAIGDALGMPTQLLSRDEIRARWGGRLRGFEPAPPGHPIAAGLPAGAITDDTEQAVLLGRLLVVRNGTVNPRELAEALVSWERDMAARGSLDLLGASNGAAMRIPPLAVAVPLNLLDPRASSGLATPSSLSVLVDQVVAVSMVTHNTGLALAVAAAVGAGVSGASIAAATRIAVAAARIAAGRGHWVAGADVAARIQWATGLVAGRDQEEAAELIYTLVGTSLATQESVPAAFAVLAAVPDDPWQAGLLAASLGGDGDTIAAIAGAVAGACHGVDAFPPQALAVVDAHGLGLAALADDLYALRSAAQDRQ